MTQTAQGAAKFANIFRTMRIRILACLVATLGLWGQDFRSTLQGTITDQTQGVVSGASVSIKNIDTNTDRQMTTDENGFYLFQFLPS